MGVCPPLHRAAWSAAAPSPMICPMHAAESSKAWDDQDLRDNPHEAADKAQRVQRMFSAIAPSYDLNNRLHSLWRDQAWRRKAVSLCAVRRSDVVLDVACGTGDLSLAFARAGAKRVIGVDFTHEMLRIGRQKIVDAVPSAPVELADGDAMRLPIADRSVDVVSIAFGIRNVSNPLKALREFHRVLRPGGRLCILEFSLPGNPLLRGGYNLFFKHIMPRTATLISRDRSGAYRYLPRSVNTFLGREAMAGLMSEAGFVGVRQAAMTFGIAVAYLGRRA